MSATAAQAIFALPIFLFIVAMIGEGLGSFDYFAAITLVILASAAIITIIITWG